MRIMPLSDLHLEFGYYTVKEVDDEKNTVLALMGDITVVNDLRAMQGFEALLFDCSKRFKAIVYIAGNHEYYGTDFDATNAALERICDLHENVAFLGNGDKTVVIDGVAFVGGTLWTACNSASIKDEMSPMAEMYWHSMSDSSIPKGLGRLKAKDIREVHLETVEKLLKSIAYQKSEGNKVVLMTHHAPSLQSIGQRFSLDPLNMFYATDLVLELVEAGVDLCLHGHMHDNKDYPLAESISDARVVCNPRGYHGYATNRSFNETLVIEI